MEKAEARRQIRDALTRISEEERELASEQIASRILSLPEFRRAASVMLFASLPDEFDTMPLIEESLNLQKRVYLPRVDWRARKLNVCRMRSVSDLDEGYMGILEPCADEVLPASELDFILVPGLGFDRHGQRLGRGAGYYDRLLSEPNLRAVLCGACYAVQVVDHVPHERWDRPIHMLVTEREATRFA